MSDNIDAAQHQLIVLAAAEKHKSINEPAVAILSSPRPVLAAEVRAAIVKLIEQD